MEQLENNTRSNIFTPLQPCYLGDTESYYEQVILLKDKINEVVEHINEELGISVPEEISTTTGNTYNFYNPVGSVSFTDSFEYYEQLKLLTDKLNEIISYIDDGGSVTPTEYPIASTSSLGGIIVGDGLSVTGEGVLSSTSTTYELPTATATRLGGVKIGTGINVTSGTISFDTSELDSLIADIDSIQVTIDKLNSDFELIKIDLESFSNSLDELDVRVGTVEGDITGIESDLVEKDNEIHEIILKTEELQRGDYLTAGDNINLTKTEEGVTISSTGSSYVLPIANSLELGGVKTGGNIEVNSDGVISFDTSDIDSRFEAVEAVFVGQQQKITEIDTSLESVISEQGTQADLLNSLTPRVETLETTSFQQGVVVSGLQNSVDTLNMETEGLNVIVSANSDNIDDIIMGNYLTAGNNITLDKTSSGVTISSTGGSMEDSEPYFSPQSSTGSTVYTVGSQSELTELINTKRSETFTIEIDIPESSDPTVLSADLGGLQNISIYLKRSVGIELYNARCTIYCGSIEDNLSGSIRCFNSYVTINSFVTTNPNWSLMCYNSYVTGTSCSSYFYYAYLYNSFANTLRFMTSYGYLGSTVQNCYLGTSCTNLNVINPYRIDENYTTFTSCKITGTTLTIYGTLSLCEVFASSRLSLYCASASSCARTNIISVGAVYLYYDGYSYLYSSDIKCQSFYLNYNFETSSNLRLSYGDITATGSIDLGNSECCSRTRLVYSGTLSGVKASTANSYFDNYTLVTS